MRSLAAFIVCMLAGLCPIGQVGSLAAVRMDGGNQTGNSARPAAWLGAMSSRFVPALDQSSEQSVFLRPTRTAREQGGPSSFTVDARGRASLSNAEPGVAAAPACPATTNLVVSGSLRFVEPGCGDGSLSTDLASETTCSLSGFAVVSPAELAAPATSCVLKPLRRARVELWATALFGNEFLFATQTDQSGSFQFCLVNELNNPVDLFINVETCTDGEGDRCGWAGDTSIPFSVVVTDLADSIYQIDTFSSTAENVCTGSVRWDIVDRRPEYNGAEHIFDVLANQALDYLVEQAGWTNDRRLQVVFPQGPTALTLPARVVQIASDDEQDSDVVLTAYGFFVEYELYEGMLPKTTDACDSHAWGVHSDPGCAWIHGTAEFLQAAIQDDPLYEDSPSPGSPDPAPFNLDGPNPHADHRLDEGAVAATLWDLFEAVGFAPLWNAFTKTPHDTCELYQQSSAALGPRSTIERIFVEHRTRCSHAGLGDSYVIG